MRRVITHIDEIKIARRGVTLVEVLMSLMIMSIGISAVAVLFPIATLRSIQAHRLTQGAIVKYNVEGLVQAEPNLIFDPDGDGDMREHFLGVAQRNYVVDPFGYYTHYSTGNYGAAAVYGNLATNPAVLPAFPPNLLPRWGGGLKTLDGFTPQSPPSPLPALPALPPTATHAAALRLLGLNQSNQGDGWSLDVDTTAVSLVTAGSQIIGVNLPQDLDLRNTPSSELLMSGFPGGANFEYLIPDPELYRIVVYSIDGLRSQTFPLTHINVTVVGSGWQNTAYWSEDITGDGVADHDYNMNGSSDIRPLPVEFGAAISRVIIQSRKVNDFNWLLTVRRRGDGFVRNVDVVVRHSDGADVQDERLFEATFVKGSAAVGIRYPLDGTTPRFRKGGFVFDAQNARWYRIQDYKERPLGNVSWAYSNYDAVVFTEDFVVDAGGEDQYTLDSSNASILLNGVLDTVGGVSEDVRQPGNGDGAMTYGFAMFPSSVVDVYPMGSMKMPSSL